MNGVTIIPRRATNYGSAVAAIPLVLGGASLVDAPSSITSLEHVVPTVQRAEASSDIGRWLDSRWESISTDVSSVLARIAMALETSRDGSYWLDTPDYAILPTPRIVEVLDVQLVEGSRAKPFRFTDTDFDVWI